jgi:hypothetical protein
MSTFIKVCWWIVGVPVVLGFVLGIAGAFVMMYQDVGWMSIPCVIISIAFSVVLMNGLCNKDEV